MLNHKPVLNKPSFHSGLLAWQICQIGNKKAKLLKTGDEVSFRLQPEMLKITDLLLL
jgi:hypothetical protein